MRLEKPVMPEEADIRQASRAFSVLRKEPTAEHYVLGSSTGTKVEISPAAFNLLLNVLEEMSRGNAVLVVPIHAELTTQEAAGLLNVSRPYLIKLLEEGKIRFQLKGKHRRILFQDLMEYKQKAARESFDALTKLAAESEELGLGM
jgi:excisionase family DNA binding protein